MDTNEYQQFESACLAELAAKQQQIAEVLLFDEQVDLPHQRILFLERDEVVLEAKVVPIGSWGVKSQSWKWAWANPSFPFGEASTVLKQLSATTGRQEFSHEKPFAVAQDAVAALVAIACRHLDALGVYQVTANDSDFYFGIRKLEHLKSLENLREKAEQAITNSVFGANGAYTLNLLRSRFPAIKLHLIGADLRGEAHEWAHDLHVQAAVDYGFVPTHGPRDLTNANLSRSRLDGTNMRGVILCGALFDGSSLVDADLSGADARGASFRGAFLNGANFTGAQLGGADFTGAELGRTLLTDVDLSQAKGLDEVFHSAPSEISLSTLIASDFKITLPFLRKAGVSRGLLQDLINGQRFAKAYQTCFLSYSSKDQEFAADLYKSLAEAGVRVFWDRFDVVPGESLEDQILEAIREHDRLLVVLSRDSIASEWVRKEIELAWYYKRDALVPVRLCQLEDIRQWTEKHEGLPDLAKLFPVPDFSGWRTPEDYHHTFSVLLKSLSAGLDFSSNKSTLPA